MGEGAAVTKQKSDTKAGAAAPTENPFQNNPRLLSSLLTSSMTAIGVCDADGWLVFANPALITMWGYEADEPFLGRHITEFWVEKGVDEFMGSLFGSGRAVGEGLGKRRDGSLFNVQYIADLIRDDDGNPLYMFGSFMDVTEQKATVEALRRSEATFNSLFRAAPIGIGLVTDRVLRFVNRQVCEMTGYLAEELIGQSARVLYENDEEFERVGKVKYDEIEERGAGSVETRFVRKDGSALDVLLSSSPVKPRDLSEGVIFTAMDITDRTRTEQALRDSEERYRLLFERNLAGVFRTSIDGRLIECNEAFARIFGYRSPGQAIRESKLETHIEPSFGERFNADLLELGRLINYEFEAKTRDGSPVSLLLNASLVPGDDGTGHLIEGTAYDITAHRATEQQLRQALKMEAVGQLAGGIAHDFNNLLMAITSYTDLLEDRLGPDHAFERYTDGIRDTIDRASGLVRKILAFGRKQMLQPTILNLNTVVEDMEQMLARTIPENIRLTTDFEPDLNTVQADRSQVEQVIVNLAINSRDAMPTGGSLSISTRNLSFEEDELEGFPGLRPGSYAELEVSDTGKGMSRETMSHIFEPFFTTKSPGQGTGLGLAQVWGIVKQSGGYIYVDSDRGRGTSFRIYLPTVEASEEAIITPPEKLPSVGGRETILLAEDDDDVRSAIAEGLSSLGYTVLEASDGDHALEVASGHANRIHALITDMVMPGIGVDDMVDRASTDHPGLRVLYITGYSIAAIDTGSRDSGDSAMLQKPFSLHDLAVTLRRLLDGEFEAGVSS
jgi:PAS domain S-box-containing protein